MSKLRLAISLDCADPSALGSFWAALLDGEILRATDTVAVVKVDPTLLLVAMAVENYVPPTWPEGSVPKQAHIDVEVDDLNGATRRAVSLGAVPAESQQWPDRYRVLFDPAGHPFCLSTEFPTG